MPIPGVTSSSDNRQPGTPTIGAATAGNASVSVAFTSPANTGKPNTSLTYTATTTPGSITGTGSASPVTISGLSNGTSYTAVVKLNNTVQDSLSSAASNSFTPIAPPFFPFFPTFGPFFPPFFPSFQPAPTISNLTFTYGGIGTTTGTLTWTATNADVWLFTSNYPGTYPPPYNYGAYTGSWPGNLINIDFNILQGITTPAYTFTIEVRNNAGASASQTITVP